MTDRRPGTKGASQLLKSVNVSEWQSMLLSYDDAVSRVARAKKRPELEDLDKWMWNDFPRLVNERTPPSCNKEELTRIMQWKLLRGKNRPALLNLIKQNSASSVDDTSAEAFHLLFSSNGASWKQSLSKLAELRGVGPATASAVLAPLFSSIPFMADEPLEAVTHSKRDYTLGAYDSMHHAMHALCETTLGSKLSPEQAGKALWVAAVLSTHPPVDSSPAPATTIPAEAEKKPKTRRSTPSTMMSDDASCGAKAQSMSSKQEEGDSAQSEPLAGNKLLDREERRAKRAKIMSGRCLSES